MTDTQLTAILGFASTIATLLFTHWKAEQSLRERAIELKEKTEDTANRLAEKTDALHDQQMQELRKQSAELKENTQLTIIGNAVKQDILENRQAIASTKAEVSDLKSATANAQLNRIETTGADTNTTVRELKESK